MTGGIEGISDFGQYEMAIVATPVTSIFGCAKILIENGVKNLLLEKPGGINEKQITDLNANVSIFTDMKPEPQIVEVIERNKAKLFICKDANILRQDAKNE